VSGFRGSRLTSDKHEYTEIKKNIRVHSCAFAVQMGGDYG
jgi:hypothetical protein